MPFPNLPYFVDADGFKLSESMAIHQYIAENWNPELCGETVEDKGRLEMVRSVVADVSQKTRGPCYSPDTNRQEHATKVLELVKPVARFQESTDFLIGDSPCYADFFWYELLQAIDMIAEG